MKVIRLESNPRLYSCNAYLVLGSWNTLADVNTLVDIGQDGFVITEIESISTGVGKRPVEQVVLTHSHFDHAAGLGAVKRRFDPIVRAFGRVEGSGSPLANGEIIRMGDAFFEVIHIPGHSNDSIFLYSKSEGVLFSGDSPVNIRSSDGTYSEEFTAVMERVCALPIETIYSGHDDPITDGARSVLRRSLENIRRSEGRRAYSGYDGILKDRAKGVSGSLEGQ
ncbi:MAG TPA: MBL fold metallo-hydrolase [Spirochaetota bacterium]|nr:MBL fold metallo-hydrolase [Spirochaetota bacterium]HNU92301.1 MBL fold metallo-hydrolase [Spirochaetota bacterium]HPV96656.1 MBL fold metallo-hydrolase [Spirochaetota bacterium]